MKAKYCILVGVMFFSSLMYGQQYKRNYNWTIGTNPVVKFSFSFGLAIDTVDNAGVNNPPFCILSTASASISDTLGLLQFFTNGYIIYDSGGFAMQNGLYVNCPYGNVLADYYGLNSLFDQTSIILPKKGNTYYVFNTGMSDSFANNYLNQVNGAYWDVLSYSIVDMDSNAGKGKVVQKNVVLTDSQKYANTAMHAVKHNNGKDWWLVKADCYNNRYQEFLIKEDTILGPFYQTATDSLSNAFCIGGLNQIYFNEQGTQMASGIYGTLKSGIFYDFNRVDIYDFNRCDGTLTFKKYYEVPYDTSTYINDDYKQGICFSPNSKLLYMGNNYSMYQIDLEDTNTYNALLIHGPDTSNLSYFPLYSMMALAPDGKMYIGNSNGTRKYMSYIDSPDIKGLGCNFVPQGVWQPYTNLMSPPNMPNYGLGPDTSVICWPLASSHLTLTSKEFEVYPNPASTVINIKTESKEKRELYNSLGQLLFSTDKNEINVSRYYRGIYYIKIENTVKKIIIE